MRPVVLAVLAAGLTACAAPAEQGLRYRMPEDPPSLDPIQAGDDNSLVYVYMIFDGLVEYVPGGVEVRPAVAAAWEVAPDGRTYTFHLRPGVTFHNGREVTAQDVVFSIRRALSQAAKSQKRGFFEALAGASAFWEGVTADLPGVAAPDARTVVFRLEHPYDGFLRALASEAGSIVPREVYEAAGEPYMSRPVGCGPFRLAAWQRGVAITLERHARHWKPRPEGGIERITVRFISSASTALEEYRAGHLDVLTEVPPGQREQVRREMPDRFHNWRKQMLLYLGFNHAAPPFRDAPLLRRALGHAIDRDYIVRVLNEGKDAVAAGVIPEGLDGHDPARPPIGLDLGRAARLLEEAGHPGGRGLPELTYVSNQTEGFRRLSERLRADLGRIGVKVGLRMMDLNAYLQTLGSAAGAASPPFHLYRVNWYPDYPDADNFLTEQFVPGRSGDFGLYDSPRVTDLLARARREIDAAARSALYREVESLLLEDAAVVPIYWVGQDLLLRPEYHGLRPGPMGPYAIAWEEVTRRP